MAPVKSIEPYDFINEQPRDVNWSLKGFKSDAGFSTDNINNEQNHCHNLAHHNHDPIHERAGYAWAENT